MGLYGKMPGVAYQDYQAAKLIVIWGATAGMLRSLYERLHDDAPEAMLVPMET